MWCTTCGPAWKRSVLRWWSVGHGGSPVLEHRTGSKRTNNIERQVNCSCNGESRCPNQGSCRSWGCSAISGWFHAFVSYLLADLAVSRHVFVVSSCYSLFLYNFNSVLRYVAWLRTRYGVKLQSIKWLWLPKGAPRHDGVAWRSVKR